MADRPTRPRDFPGVVVGGAVEAAPRSHFWLSTCVTADGPSPMEVAKVLNGVGASYVLIGGHAVSCWAAAPRATAYVDMIVFMRDFRRAQEAVAQQFPALTCEEHGAVARFTVADPQGSAEAVDLIRSYDALMLSALENRADVLCNGVRVPIPSPEMLIALKAAAIGSASRTAAAQLQDAADIASVAFERTLQPPLLEELSSLLTSGRDRGLLRDVIESARSGGDVLAVCRRA